MLIPNQIDDLNQIDQLLEQAVGNGDIDLINEFDAKLQYQLEVILSSTTDDVKHRKLIAEYLLKRLKLPSERSELDHIMCNKIIEFIN